MSNFVFDMDGTLSYPGDRIHKHPLNVKRNKSVEDLWKNFYQGCSLDIPNIAVLNIAKNLNGNIFIITGRDENARFETELWLKKNGLKPLKVYMRPLKDKRKVAEIKLEQIQDIISKHGNISCIFDDDIRNIKIFKDYPTVHIG